MLGELIDGKNNTVKKRGNSVPEEVPNTAVFVPKKNVMQYPSTNTNNSKTNH